MLEAEAKILATKAEARRPTPRPMVRGRPQGKTLASLASLEILNSVLTNDRPTGYHQSFWTRACSYSNNSSAHAEMVVDYFN